MTSFICLYKPHICFFFRHHAKLFLYFFPWVSSNRCVLVIEIGCLSSCCLCWTNTRSRYLSFSLVFSLSLRWLKKKRHSVMYILLHCLSIWTFAALFLVFNEISLFRLSSIKINHQWKRLKLGNVLFLIC